MDKIELLGLEQGAGNLGQEDREGKECRDNDCCNEERFLYAALLEGGAAAVTTKSCSQACLVPLQEDGGDEEY